MHCKDISVREVDFPLTEKSITEAMSDWIAYRRAEHVVLKNSDKYAIVKLCKESDDSLFEKVTSFEIISLPDETVFVERPDTDVLNLTAMARIQLEFPEKAVVVRGLFSHVSFVKNLVPLFMNVVDIIPPNPSKLRYLVDLALSTGYITKPIVPVYNEIDISRCASEAGTPAVMFPCAVSGAESDKSVYYLDQVPDISGKNLTLIGCRLSKRIFEEHYDSDVPFINICPRDAISDRKTKTLVKCCRIKEGHEISGNVASLPWGVTVPEIVDAINDLFRDVRTHRKRLRASLNAL